ncbi:MAG: Transcriptional regulator, GntR family [Hyphomicrobiales bacterium]|nr:Transcriptional regulator, GntR family [Hyphomicrobiales bacterium]
MTMTSIRRRPGRHLPTRPISALARVPTPIYVQLVTLFRRRIETGEWQLNQQVPTLDELAEELGVARATVRHAIGFLESEGLIGRYRGRGTFVLRKPESEVWLDIPTEWSELVENRPGIAMEWLECVPATTLPVPSHEGGILAEEYQLLRRVHRRGSVPYLVGTSFVERNIYKTIGKKGFTTATPLRALHSVLGSKLGRVEQTVTVSAADVELAELLNVPVNSPLMVLKRSIFDTDNYLIYESEGLHRGDFVRMHVRLR